MGKKKRMTPDEYAAWKARKADLDRRMLEAIARRKAMLAEQQRAEGETG